tara:strand:+ start:4523 stop:4756 length:234 start_codon:yes stop_codon:yes gene_type:complete
MQNVYKKNMYAALQIYLAAYDGTPLRYSLDRVYAEVDLVFFDLASILKRTYTQLGASVRADSSSKHPSLRSQIFQQQ